jgi:CRP/FNR family transcriptional regulator, cyclic AMP receptor protein
MGPSSGFWGDLPPADRAVFQEAGQWRDFPAGRTLLREGDPGREVVVVWRGFVKVYSRMADDRQVILAVRGPGDIIGEMANVGGGPRCATVAAIGRVKALVVDGTLFAGTLGGSTVVQRVLIARLREADRNRLDSDSTSVVRRLARLLLDFTHRFGEPTADGGLRIGLALSQKELAACVGGSPRSVARVMRDWRQRGFVATGRQWVVVNSPADLDRIAGQCARPR